MSLKSQLKIASHLQCTLFGPHIQRLAFFKVLKLAVKNPLWLFYHLDDLVPGISFDRNTTVIIQYSLHIRNLSTDPHLLATGFPVYCDCVYQNTLLIKV